MNTYNLSKYQSLEPLQNLIFDQSLRLGAATNEMHIKKDRRLTFLSYE